MIIHNEKEIRAVIKKVLIKEQSERAGGSAEFGSFGGVGIGSRGSGASDDENTGANDIDISDDDLKYIDVDELNSKLKTLGAKRTANINSVRRMAVATGLRIDFVYGIQTRESGGKAKAMALNPHLLSTPNTRYATNVGINEKERKRIIAAWKAKGVETRKESVSKIKNSGSYFNAHTKNKDVFDKMYKISPTGTITGAALGLYQVLGYFMLGEYGNDGTSLYNNFQANPIDYSQRAFIKWVNHSSNSKFKSLVNSGENNWSEAVTMYYGKNNTDYVNHVKEYARYFRESVNSIERTDNLDGKGNSRPSSGLDSWKGRLGERTGGGINFHKILDNRNNYRAGIKNKHTNPTVDFWKELSEEYGIKNVISLNADEGGRSAANNAKEAGLNVFKNFIYEDDMGNRSAFDKAKEMLKDGNTLIHCTHGADRTGAYVGRYYMEEFNWDFNRAMADTKKYGGHKSGANYKSARDFLEFGPAGSLTEADFGSFGGVGIGGKNNGVSSKSGKNKVNKDILNVSRGSIALVGDSQVGNGLGIWIKNRFNIGKERVSMLVGGHAGTVVNQPDFGSTIKDADLVILTLGGHPSNKVANCRVILNKIYELAPNASIVWIGGPPAFEPTSSNSMVSKDPNSDNYWQKKRNSRCERNEKVIRSVVNSHTKQPAFFINPCNDLSINDYKPSSGDGIHVPTGYGDFLDKYLGSSTPMIS